MSNDKDNSFCPGSTVFISQQLTQPKRDPIIIPLFSKKALWPLQDVLQLQNNVQLNNPPLSLTPLSYSISLSLPAADHDGKMHLTSPQSHQARGFHTLKHASLPWLPQTSTPRRWTSLSIIFGQVSGRRMLLSAAVKNDKGDTHARLRSSAVWGSAGDWSASAPSFPSFQYARSRSPLVHWALSSLRCGPPPPQHHFSPPSLLETVDEKMANKAKHVYVFQNFLEIFKTCCKVGRGRS